MAKTSTSSNITIGVFAPSSIVEREDIEAATALIEARGCTVFVHPQTYARENQSAGSHTQKLEALYDLYRDQDIDVIWAAGGGNRVLHIIDQLDFDLIKAHPKPMVGFSDVSALLNAISVGAGITTIHGAVFKNLPAYQSMGSVFSLLSGDDVSMPLEDARILNQGRAEGRLFGGNLSVFQYLPQTLNAGDDAWLDGAILFLEDCNEELSRIDRMLAQIKRLGVFARIGGVVFGQFTDIKDSSRPFGYTLEGIMREHLAGCDIPVLVNAPFGHGADLHPLPVGGTAVLDTTKTMPVLTSRIG